MKSLELTPEIRRAMIATREQGHSIQHIANMFPGASFYKIKEMFIKEGRPDLTGRNKKSIAMKLNWKAGGQI